MASISTILVAVMPNYSHSEALYHIVYHPRQRTARLRLIADAIHHV